MKIMIVAFLFFITICLTSLYLDKKPIYYKEALIAFFTTEIIVFAIAIPTLF